jgi:CHAD domain-containing protein
MKKIWNDDKSLSENLGKVLPKLTQEFFQHGQAAVKRGSSWRDLHGFRLAAKRYRYSLELFLPLYGPGLKVKVEVLRGLQRLLGQINDCVTARRLLKDIRGTEATRASLEKRMERKASELRRYWKEHFEPERTEAVWSTYLARHGRTIYPGTDDKK